MWHIAYSVALVAAGFVAGLLVGRRNVKKLNAALALYQQGAKAVKDLVKPQ